MAVNCDPSTLANDARCWAKCLSGMEPAVQTYLLAVIAGGSTDPKELLRLASSWTVTWGTEEAIKTYLLCQIANA